MHSKILKAKGQWDIVQWNPNLYPDPIFETYDYCYFAWLPNEIVVPNPIFGRLFLKRVIRQFEIFHFQLYPILFPPFFLQKSDQFPIELLLEKECIPIHGQTICSPKCENGLYALGVLRINHQNF